MGAEILIVDNDPLVCKLSNELLREVGFSTQMIQDGKLAIPAIREQKPRAVLLDILMPGVDGLNLCRTIKADHQIGDTKVIIVSGKTFDVEKDRAKRFGADLFIEKPYNVDTFAQAVVKIVGSPQNPSAISGGATNTMANQMQLQIWGSRSLTDGAVPKKGLHTPCISLETEDRFFIFDAGSGITELGNALSQSGRHKDIWLFLTHFHPAHVYGLGTFPCTRDAAFNIRICGPDDPEKTLEQCVRTTFQESYATDRRPIKAAIQLYTLQEGNYDLAPGMRVQSFYANHPTTTLGFTLETQGRKLFYCPDSEIYGGAATALQDYDEMLKRVCKDADVAIHDARYRSADYPAHKNQGHSSVEEAVEFASDLEIGRLVLFHQDASYSQGDLDAMEQEAKQAIKSKKSSLNCLVAREDAVLKL